MENADKVVAILIGLAIVAVVVSQGSATSSVITNITSALVGLIQNVMGPISSSSAVATPSASNTSSTSIAPVAAATTPAPNPQASAVAMAQPNAQYGLSGALATLQYNLANLASFNAGNSTVN